VRLTSVSSTTVSSVNGDGQASGVALGEREVRVRDHIGCVSVKERKPRRW
jgi:hypothetical protein